MNHTAMSDPRFSIIITCHNQSAYIRDAVNSALAQPCTSKEVIVVDDASKDDSPAVLKQYGKKIRFAAFQINRGATMARNLGAAMASGEYFVFLDGDDVLLPWALDVYNGVIDARNPKIILSSMAWFDEAPPKIDAEETPKEIEFTEYRNLIERDRRYQAGGSAMVVERQAFEEVGGWTDNFFPLEDIDLMMKLGHSGLTVQVLSPETKGYRIHAANTRHQTSKMIAALYKVIQLERAGSYPGGAALRFERYATLGAPVYFWIKMAYAAGRYKTACKVLARGWPMFLAAVARKVKGLLRGRRRPEIIALKITVPHVLTNQHVELASPLR